jgi:hypothetical protein
MNVEALASLNSIPVDERVKTLTALMYQGDDSVVSFIVSRADDRQTHELCLRALRLLTDARLEIARL